MKFSITLIAFALYTVQLSAAAPSPASEMDAVSPGREVKRVSHDGPYDGKQGPEGKGQHHGKGDHHGKEGGHSDDKDHGHKGDHDHKGEHDHKGVHIHKGDHGHSGDHGDKPQCPATVNPCAEARKVLKPLYSTYHDKLLDHFYSDDMNDILSMGPQGFAYVQNFGQILSQPVNGSIAIYRMYLPGGSDHVVVREDEKSGFSNRGYTQQRHLGYIFPDARCGFTPWFRMNFPGQDHFLSTSFPQVSEYVKIGQYALEGILGYWVV